MTNYGNVDMAIREITGLPSNLKYTIEETNYKLREKICDDNDSTNCTLGAKKTIYITVGYKDSTSYDGINTSYNINLNFDFKQAFSISYVSINNNNYPTSILEGETLNITFIDDIPNSVSVTGVTNSSYTSPTLTLEYPVEDVVVRGVAASKHYDRLEFDGTNYIDTNIKLFSEENITKNFEISFDLDNFGSNQTTQATLINSMKEQQPYPGFLLRIQTNGTQLEFNSPKIKNKTGINLKTLQRIVLKRINDIYYIQVNNGNVETLGTYNGTTFDTTLVLGASIDGNGNPWRYFVGTISNINIELSDPETYTVKFNKNDPDATGTMTDQTIRVDDTVNLKTNTFVNEGSMFESWNTKADGTGTTYFDGASVTNLAAADHTITLYAQWMPPIKYYVEFNANGGTGTMSNQQFTFGTAQALSANTFTKTDRIFVKWNTKADGTGTDYYDAESVKNLTKIEDDIVELYAIWAEEYYSYPSQFTFDGTNYLNSNINLYSTANVSKDYEISFEIVSNGSNPNQATLMNSMYEVTPWPGVLFRVANTQNFEVDMNGGSGSFKKNFEIATTNKVVIERKSGIIYITVNDGETITGKDHSSITTFDIPVIFGASMLSDQTPQRYYKGTLKNMKVILYE